MDTDCSDFNNIQPTCSVEEARAFFSAEYASHNNTFSQPEGVPTSPWAPALFPTGQNSGRGTAASPEESKIWIIPLTQGPSTILSP